MKATSVKLSGDTYALARVLATSEKRSVPSMVDVALTYYAQRRPATADTAPGTEGHHDAPHRHPSTPGG